MSLKNKIFLKSFLVIALFSISLQAFATWVPPLGTPPTGDTKPPINTSSTTQAKDGGIVAWGGLRGNVLVVDSGSDLNGRLNVAGITTLENNTIISPGKTLTINTETYTFPVNQTADGYLKTDGAGNLTWASAGGITDGDKGDITVSGSGTVWTVDNTAITFAKIQNVGANKFLANLGNSAGTLQEININRIPLFATAITGTPGSTNYLRGDGSWQVINSLTDGDKGDITVSTSGSVWNIDPGVVGNTELGADSITSDKIAADGVTKADIAAVFGGANKLLGIDDTGASLEYKGLVAGSGITITHDVNNGNITFTANGGITDGDKGDITVSGTGTVWTVDALSITNGKIAGNAVTVPKVSISGTATDEFCLTYETTGTTFEWQACGGADNLGNHTATQALQMAGFTINGSSVANGDLILDSTSNGSLKGDVVINPVNGSVGVGQPIGTTFVSKLEVAGAVATTLGSASAPTRTFLGDTNNGTFSPGADIFAISTAGTERLRVSATGQVGIGKTPTQLLDVNGDALINGRTAGRGNNTGSDNTAFGTNALNASNTGNNNTAFGSGTLQINSGGANTAVGSFALNGNTTGANNVAFGTSALEINVGNQNVAIGVNAASTATNLTGVIAIGYNVQPTTGGEIRIGTASQTSTYIAGIHGSTSSSGINVLVNSSGKLGTTTSSLRFKDNIVNITGDSSRIYNLRPVSFNYKEDLKKGLNITEYGLIAEEVEKIFPELVVYDENKKPFTLKYQFLPILMLNEQIKDHNKLEKLEKENQDLRNRLEILEAKIK